MNAITGPRRPVPSKPHITRRYNPSWGAYEWLWSDGAGRWMALRDDDHWQEPFPGGVPARLFIDMLQQQQPWTR